MICEIAIGILVVCCIIYIQKHKYEFMTTKKVSNLDDKSYRVVGGFVDSHKAADKMAELHAFIINYLRYVRSKFIINGQGTLAQQQFITRMLNNYNPDVIFENDPRPGGETSFVVNKGDEFGVCLREKVGKDKTQFHDHSILRFVILHELTHLGTSTYGHNYEFWSSFKFVLTQAVEANLYQPIDYSLAETNYCGLIVEFNPYFSNEYVSL